MREIGSLPAQEMARTFSDYLLTRGIKSSIEAEAEQWTLWVFEEDQVERAKQELQQFRESPEAPMYREAADAAAGLRKKTAQEQEKAAKRRKKLEMQPSWRKPAHQRIPVTFTLLMISIFITLMTSFGREVEPIRSWISIVPLTSPEPGMAKWEPSEGLQSIRQGQVWRLFTPMFLHLTILHLLFNMYWFFFFGNILETRYGTWKYLLMILVFSGISNIAQYWFEGPFFGGMSGVLYGQFGYIWIKSRLNPWEGLYLPPNLVFILLLWFFLCMTPMISNVANYAHAGGLISGMGLAFATLRR